jgi:uncharacterized membrane protein
MKRSGNPKNFLTEDESAPLAEAVQQAEGRTSAEIKVVIVRHCWGDIRDKALATFRKLALDDTRDRNCVMIMLVLANREFLIYGDTGIHEKVGQDFWDEVRDEMAARFREGEFGEGLRSGVLRAGEKLAEHFPRREDDRDEISDEVAYEE